MEPTGTLPPVKYPVLVLFFQVISLLPLLSNPVTCKEFGVRNTLRGKAGEPKLGTQSGYTSLVSDGTSVSLTLLLMHLKQDHSALVSGRCIILPLVLYLNKSLFACDGSLACSSSPLISVISLVCVTSSSLGPARHTPLYLLRVRACSLGGWRGHVPPHRSTTVTFCFLCYSVFFFLLALREVYIFC